MSARDVLASSLYDDNRTIAGKNVMPMTWDEYRRANPEGAMVYETQAISHFFALRAAGYAVVPREPTTEMTLAANKRVAVLTPDGTWALGRDEAARCYRAMLAAGEATP